MINLKSKLLPLLLIIGGLLIAWFGGGEKIISSRQKVETSLAEAHEIVNSKDNSSNNVANDQSAAQKKFNTGDTIGLLIIPKIEAELPIVEGTDPDDLEKGVGHYKESSYPDEGGQIVLSGHRDTVFRHTGELEVGDKLTISLSYGSFEYKITHTKIVDKADKSVITLQRKKEELILTTCYPFSYIGNAPDRYIIYAEPS